MHFVVCAKQIPDPETPPAAFRIDENKNEVIPAQGIAPVLSQFDGIAAMDDLIEFFKRLPSPDKQFTVMNGISHASFQQKNYKMVYHILHSYFTQPAPAYTSAGAPH